MKGKPLYKILLDLLIKSGISGAPYGRGSTDPGSARSISEYATSNEVIDERPKLEPLLPETKMFVDDNGLVALQEIEVL